ncbi:HNH endonuclease, partial [Pseudarthrobacter oxydans]
MEASGDQLAEHCGSTAVLTRAGSVSSRGLEAYDGDAGLGFAGRLRAVPAPVTADVAEPLSGAGHAADALPSENASTSDQPLASQPLPSGSPSSPDQPLAVAPLPPGNPSSPDQPLSLSKISGLLAAAAAAAPRILAAADYVEAANYAGQVEELSRSVEYLQILGAGTVDRTRTQAIAAADTARASRSRTGKGWVTGWDNGVETLNETGTAWPEDSGLNSSPASVSTASGPLASGSAARGARAQIEPDRPSRVITSPADDGCANTAEFLRLRLRIGKSEAHRRLALAADILPATTLTGDSIPATRGHLAAALAPTPAPAPAPDGDRQDGGENTAITSQATTGPVVSSRAGTIIALTLNRLGHLVTPERL